ncbi:MAG TPA: PSD1 and planctomycete cytochrome C domain-containing protein [Pirellulales bacterium]|jgi:mono/diheme cytochrome c family protein|nr:PSD1 and planctomycete cytochrome C domain-containing protein [Pirellulales bacterium]
MSRLRLANLLIGAILAVSGEFWAFAAPPAKSKAAKAPASPSAAADRKIDFIRDIRPIFQQKCYRCHGPENQKSGYRLDVRSIAMTRGDAYAPNILPGKATDSPLLRFVAGLDDDVAMPPKGPRLPATDVGLLRAWIEQGAVWPDEASGTVTDKLDWWSLKTLLQPPVPTDSLTPPSPNPIDAFIERTLREKGFPQAPEADRRTLIRRLNFDLIGLPPTPEEVAAFVNDNDPKAYEHVVDRLLDSPRYGERWARHWMDAAHFAETHGHDQDRIREYAWPYRDYLIAAFNADKPYGRFVEEQVAGDVLFPDDPQATVALGFLAAGPWDESSLRDIQENTLDRKIARYIDRDDMVSNVMNNFVSATVQCARCHDHKFDPISQQDYYALQADFAGVDKATRAYDVDPAVGCQRRELLQRKRLLDRDEPESVAWLLSPPLQAQAAQWERDLSSHRVQWTMMKPLHVASAEGSTLTVEPDDSVLSTGTRPDCDTYTISAIAPLAEMTAIRLEVLADDRFPHHGPGRQDNGNLHLSEIQVFAGDAVGRPLPISRAVADFNQDGWGIERAIDGLDATAWGIYPQVGRSHLAVFEFDRKLSLASGSKLTVVLKQLHGGGHLIGRARLSVADAAPPVGLEVLPSEISAILKKSIGQRTDSDRVTIARFQQRSVVLHGLATLPKPSFVFAAASDFEPDGGHVAPHGPRPVAVLHRGDILQPRGAAVPGALSCVTRLESRFKLPHADEEGERRAALAHWLSDKRNPLTWRSIVNRVWQYHFGRGLVDTPNDFGRMGALPTNPALLDWLAVQFRDHGQSIKQLNRLIVTSRTYRQSSRIADIGGARAAAAIAADVDSRFLWRMNRQRLDAECLRDAVLMVSGRLDLRMGGPSDRQFELRPGVHVTPVVDYSKFDWNSDAGRRRSIYRFLFRTLPDPFMETLDCPSGDEITAVRTNSVTVQQALALWNDAFIARHCEFLAARLQAMGSTNRARVDAAVQLVFGRPARAEELADFTAYADQHGLANLCRVLLNANEFVFVN